MSTNLKSSLSEYIYNLPQNQTLPTSCQEFVPTSKELTQIRSGFEVESVHQLSKNSWTIVKWEKCGLRK